MSLTHLVSTIRFQKSLESQDPKKVPPKVPYWTPFVCHMISLMRTPAPFADDLMKKYGYNIPLSIQAGLMKLCFVSSPEQIQTIFKDSKSLSSKPSTLYCLKNIIDTPPEVLPYYAADDSGMANKIRKGSVVTKQEERMHFWAAHTAQKYLSGQTLLSVSERYISTLDRNLEALNIGNDWVEVPDLLKFLQDEITSSTIEALMGSHVLRLNPTLVQDFWEFDYNMPNYVRGLPRWLVPSAFKVRDRMIASMKKWHLFAHEHSDVSKIAPDDPDWDPYFGTKLVKARLFYGMNNKHTNAASRASEDVGLILAGNANVIPSLFWYIYEALKDRTLQDRLMKEVSPCISEQGQLDIVQVTSQPLLQSVFAETLRLRVAITMTRTAEYSDYQLGSYKIKKDIPLVIFSRTAALNAEGWTNAGREPVVPLEKFWAERFLVKPGQKISKTDPELSYAKAQGSAEQTMAGSEKESNFSIEGLAGCWLPFGGGQRMCPGRHLAKHEIIGSFALLFSKYEIEMIDNGLGEPKPDMRWYPMGGLPPMEKFPFRIRKRT
ncbi:cytochrome P450 [Mollisia scopiformis]|uniref:Cytochrome P450 n=1 Tax=Mollisia scopiformis TaxID=149040 RepID=A0A194WSL0_MOLSC|nr:cytochrome P450 [Mollisia scopiformis]KUJ10945.1 cytochrome P450 [Mollisia scopiformis]